MRRTLVAVAACLSLASCTSPSSGTDASTQAPGSGVDVDTPALRALKAEAGVEACSPPDTAERGSAGGLPKVTLPCLGGGRDVDLSRLRGPMVINLFAQWCGPCRKELPYYQAMHEKAKGKVRVLGVDYLDTQPARALELVKGAGVTYPLVADPSGALRKELKVRGLPGVVFLAEDGTVTDVEFRVIRSYAELRALVRQRLGVALAA